MTTQTLSIVALLISISSATYNAVQITSPSLPRNSYAMAVAYDATTDTILLAGGKYNERGLITFRNNNFTDVSVTYLPYAVSGWSQYYTLLGDSLWMIHSPNTFISIHKQTHVVTEYPSIIIPISVSVYGCLSHIDNGIHQYLIILGGNNNGDIGALNDVQIYNKSADHWINANKTIPSMQNARRELACIAYQDGSAGMLYAIGGSNGSVAFKSIELLQFDKDLVNIQYEHWIYLNDTLSGPAYGTRAVLYRNNIIVIGGTGYGSGGIGTDINIIDISTNTVKVNGTLAYGGRHQSPIIVSNLVYSFGGCCNHNNWQYFLLPETTYPTTSPSVTTSVSPTFASETPTSIPTHFPSNIPSSYPEINIYLIISIQADDIDTLKLDSDEIIKIVSDIVPYGDISIEIKDESMIILVAVSNDVVLDEDTIEHEIEIQMEDKYNQDVHVVVSIQSTNTSTKHSESDAENVSMFLLAIIISCSTLAVLLCCLISICLCIKYKEKSYPQVERNINVVQHHHNLNTLTPGSDYNTTNMIQISNIGSLLPPKVVPSKIVTPDTQIVDDEDNAYGEEGRNSIAIVETTTVQDDNFDTINPDNDIVNEINKTKDMESDVTHNINETKENNDIHIVSAINKTKDMGYDNYDHVIE